MESQESSQADEGEQEAPGLQEVRYTGFRGTQGSKKGRAGKWTHQAKIPLLNTPYITHLAA